MGKEDEKAEDVECGKDYETIVKGMLEKRNDMFGCFSK